MKKDRWTNLLITILIILVATLIAVQISQYITIDVKIKNAMQSISVQDGYTPVKGVDYIDGENGYTPTKGIDYFDGSDGKDGENGKDSMSTHTIETVIKEVPVKGTDGYTPEVRCNEDKNRWEVRYSNFPNWQIQYGELGQVVKCTIKEGE